MKMHKHAGVLLVMVAMLSGCFEEEGPPPFLDHFSRDGHEQLGEDCDPYFGCDEAVAIPDSGVPFDGSIDAGSVDTGCEPIEPPPCDPYSGECAGEEPREPEPEPEPEPECDPYTGECDTPGEPTDPGDPEHPGDPSDTECDPYIEVCGPPIN